MIPACFSDNNFIYLQKFKNEMSLKTEHIPHYTYGDYKLWKDDWELIDGFPFSMSPSASGKHQEISGELYFQIKTKLNGDKCNKRCYSYFELDWIIDNSNVVRPDIAVVCGGKIKDYIKDTPLLIVEVISKSSAYRDRIVKRELYEAHKVKYYLIADPDTRKVDVYEFIDGKYEPKTLSGANCDFLLWEECSITLDFSIIW